MQPTTVTVQGQFQCAYHTVVDHFTDYALVTPAEIEPAQQPSGVQVYLPLVVRQ